MPNLIDDDGYLVDASNVRINGDDGQPKQLFFKTEEDVSGAFQARLARQNKKHDATLQKMVADHEAELQGTTSPEKKKELEDKIAALSAQIEDQDTLASQREQRARGEGVRLLESEKKETEKWKKKSRDGEIGSLFSAAAGRLFYNDSSDLFMRVKDSVEWNPVLDDNDKSTGEETWSVTYDVPGEDGEMAPRTFTDADQLAEAVLAQNTHYQQGTNTGGSATPATQHRGGQPPAQAGDLAKRSANDNIDQGLRERKQGYRQPTQARR